MAYGDSTADSLAAVRAAIGRVLETQAYTVRGREQRNAELKDLMALEKQLMERANDESNSGAMCQVVQVDSPQ